MYCVCNPNSGFTAKQVNTKTLFITVFENITRYSENTKIQVGYCIVFSIQVFLIPPTTGNKRCNKRKGNKENAIK